MFDATVATEPAPGGENDDFFMVSPHWAFVLDGVSVLTGDEVGCQHGVRWYVSQLASNLAAGLGDYIAPRTLTDILRDAIARTAAGHGSDCDTTHPMTPAATVAMIRTDSRVLDWLVLGDATVAWLLNDGKAHAVTDDRVDRLPNVPIIDGPIRRYDQSYVARLRNNADGFWLAAALPEAAYQAITGQVPIDTVNRVGLYSDGVTRLVERYGSSWEQLFWLVDAGGPRALIDAVRQAEREDREPTRWRGKVHDDATVVVLGLSRTDASTPVD